MKADPSGAREAMVTVTPAQLCEVLQDRARATHELVRYSYSAGLGVSEETLTDINLVEIVRQLSKGHVFTRKFTKHDEHNLSGADWLWTIGRPGRWLSLLVQAKLARPSQPSIHGLHHGKGEQRRTLVRYAIKEHLLPVYVVYSAFDGVEPLRSAGPGGNGLESALPCRKAHGDAQLKGCVTVRPHYVASMYWGASPRARVADLIRRGLPWSCLFCCGPGSAGKELADAALAGVWNLPPSGREEEVVERADPDAPDDVDLSDELITGEAPSLVRDLLAGREPKSDPPFAAVSVVSSEPLPTPNAQRDDVA